MEEYPRKNLINTPKKMHTSYPSKSPRYAQDMFIYVQPNAFKFSAKAMYGSEILLELLWNQTLKMIQRNQGKR